MIVEGGPCVSIHIWEWQRHQFPYDDQPNPAIYPWKRSASLPPPLSPLILERTLNSDDKALHLGTLAMRLPCSSVPMIMHVIRHDTRRTKPRHGSIPRPLTNNASNQSIALPIVWANRYHNWELDRSMRHGFYCCTIVSSTDKARAQTPSSRLANKAKHRLHLLRHGRHTLMQPYCSLQQHNSTTCLP